MTELIIKNKGSLSIGSCVTTDGRKYTVIKSDDGYGLKEGLRWMKDGVKSSALYRNLPTRTTTEF